jgi:hypothetical protein
MNKKAVVIVLAMAFGFALLLPSLGEAGPPGYRGPGPGPAPGPGPWPGYGRGWYPYRGWGCGGSCGYSYNGWDVAGAALGGLIVGGVIANTLIPRYAAPPPAYAYPPPDGAPGYETPPGEWIWVPGQWLDGRWIPAHKAWVPINP